MCGQSAHQAVCSRVLRRAVNATLAIFVLVQPGCMCGCSAPPTVASARTRDDEQCSSSESCKHCDNDDEIADGTINVTSGYRTLYEMLGRWHFFTANFVKNEDRKELRPTQYE